MLKSRPRPPGEILDDRHVVADCTVQTVERRDRGSLERRQRRSQRSTAWRHDLRGRPLLHGEGPERSQLSAFQIWELTRTNIFFHMPNSSKVNTI